MSFGMVAASYLSVTEPQGYRLYSDSPILPTASWGYGDPITLGMEFYVSVAMKLQAILWWQPTTGASSSGRTVGLYTTTDGLSGTLIGSKTQAVSGVGWQTVTFDTPISLTPGTTYRAAVYHPNGQYSAIDEYYYFGGPGYGVAGEGITVGQVTVPGTTDALNAGQGTYRVAAALTFPEVQAAGAHFGIDILVEEV